MSDLPPSRQITGLRPTRQPDVSRLVAANRTPAPPAPPALTRVEDLPEAEQEPVEQAAAPTAQTAPKRAKEPALVPRAAVPAEAPKVGVNLYLTVDTNERARAAFKATAHLEGDLTWSAFVDRAILAETERRELEHNKGKPFAAVGRLRAGRPLKD